MRQQKRRTEIDRPPERRHLVAIDTGLRAGCASFMFESSGRHSLGAAATHHIRQRMSGVVDWQRLLDSLAIWKLSPLFLEPIDLFAIEQPSGMRRKGVTPGQSEAGRSKQYLMVGIYTALIYQQFPDVLIVHVPAQTAKAACCGRANASKQDVKRVARSLVAGFKGITDGMKDWEVETIADCYAIALGGLRIMRRQELKELR